MKIDNSTLSTGLINESRVSSDKQNAAAQQAAQQPAPAATPPAGTSVSLGSTATQLGKMEASMTNAPVVDAKKVAEIKQAIRDGKFQVNTGVVADRLIQSVRDLISNNNRV